MEKFLTLNPRADSFTPSSTPSPPLVNGSPFGGFNLDIPTNLQITNLILYEENANDNKCCYCLGELTVMGWVGEYKGEWKYVCTSCVESIPHFIHQRINSLNKSIEDSIDIIYDCKKEKIPYGDVIFRCNDAVEKITYYKNILKQAK